MKLCLAIFPVGAALFAQQVQVTTRSVAAAPSAAPVVPAASSRPEDLCTIEGQVLNAATGAPVKKAQIILRGAGTWSNGPPAGAAATSDAGGKFSFKDIEPGKYWLSATRTGFADTTRTGSRALPGHTFSLDAGQHIRDVVLKLTPHGVITGRVLDEDGEPLANVNVMAESYHHIQGQKQRRFVGNARTNDLGEYRIFGLSPGRYLISGVSGQMGFDPSLVRSGTAAPEEDYIPTYYPGSTDPAAATAVEIAAGGELRGMDFTLAKGRTVRVRGRVNNAAGAARQGVFIMLMPRDRLGMFGSQRAHSADAQGNFEIHGVRPGAYTLVASVSDEGRNLSAHQALEVGANNLDNVSLTLTAGIDLTGEVKVEGSPIPKLEDLEIVLSPRDRNAMFGAGASGGRVDHQGGFKLSNASLEHYDVDVTGLPDGYYVKSLRAGDQDIRESGLDLTQGAAGDISITVSPNAGQIDGVVLNDQQPAADAQVVLIPDDVKLRARPQSYKSGSTDQRGSFAMKSIPPGDYKVYAWDDIEYGAYMDPEFLKPFESQGQSVSIHENSRESVQLKLIPATRP